MACDFLDDPSTSQRRLARALYYETLARLAGKPAWRYTPTPAAERTPPQAPVVLLAPTGRQRASHPRKAGHKVYRRWPRQAALRAIGAFWRTHERFPSDREWVESVEHGLPSAAVVHSLFGGRPQCRAAVLAHLAEED